MEILKGTDQLERAVIKKDLNTIRALINDGVDLNDGENKPIFRAAGNGDLEIVKLLKENGAYVNSFSGHRNTPLMVAATCGHLNVVRYLVRQKANVYITNERGETPLMLAKKFGHERVVEFLEKRMR